MRSFFLILITVCGLCFSGVSQPATISIPADTGQLDTKYFATQLVKGISNNYEKAAALLNWLATHFEWTATDYQKRTVKEILIRKGGNCFELATVYMALLKELGIVYRPIAEINLHRYDAGRGERAAQKVKESGNQVSVFGAGHNDHRWVEIYQPETKEWIPADPTMNLIGYESWLKARAWFGERHTLNDQFSGDMIAPFAIFVVDANNKSRMLENRTAHYMIQELDELYHHRLSALPSWQKWKKGIMELSPLAAKAFAGELNLHQYNEQIAALKNTYQSLKKEWEERKH